jgi:Protein of unknown function (DUF3616)
MTATTISRPMLTLDKTLPGLLDIRDNFSAIVVTSKFLWLGGDEGTQIDRLTLDASGNFGEHCRFELATLLPPLPSGGGTEFDIEGLDEDGGYLWLIGSNSKKRKKAEEDKSDQKNRERLADVKPDPLRHTLARVPLANGEPVAAAEPLKVARLQNAAVRIRLVISSYPNLFTSAVGHSVDITIPADVVQAGKVAAGQKVTWRVKKTGPTAAFLVPSAG